VGGGGERVEGVVLMALGERGAELGDNVWTVPDTGSSGDPSFFSFSP